MRTLVSQLGKPRNVAKPRLCPVCVLTKTAKEFRRSNRNPKLSLICWQCRKNDPKAESKLLALPSLRKRRVLNRSQRNIRFRKLYFAVVQILKRKEVKNLKYKYDAEELLKFPERVAAVIGKTYAVRGDDFTLSDDEANTRIRDLLEELDPMLIERNKNKRLSR